jgi:hypothetical protein
LIGGFDLKQKTIWVYAIVIPIYQPRYMFRVLLICVAGFAIDVNADANVTMNL